MQLEIAGAGFFADTLPYEYVSRGQMRGKLLVRPEVSVDPVPLATNLAI
jgi:hypothetical protein